MSFVAEHWEALSALLLSVVAIGIAIYSSRKTSIGATRQIESIKRLAKLQIETTIKQVEMEVVKNQVMLNRTRQEAQEVDDIMNGGLSFMTNVREMKMRDFNMRKSERDYNFYRDFDKSLKTILDSLKKIEI